MSWTSGVSIVVELTRTGYIKYIGTFFFRVICYIDSSKDYKFAEMTLSRKLELKRILKES